MGITKVLIFEHPPMNKNGVGKTLYSFFYNWPKESLAQVYSVNLPLDENLCQYFYFSELGGDKENSESARKKRENARENNFLLQLLTKFVHSDFGVVLRSAGYKKLIKRNTNIKKWISDFNPDCVFYGIGENAVENEFVLELAKSIKLPLILYISDDYMTKWQDRKSYKFYSKKLFTTYKEAIEYASLIVIISDKMKQLYSKVFPGKNYYVACNSAINKRNTYFQNDISCHDKIVFSYTGNLGLGRWQMLSEFTNTINRINKIEKNIKIFLDIYSQEKPSNEILNKITGPFTSFYSNVVGEELDKVRINSDVLLLVESFDLKYKSILSTALSTKVPEYLSYGKNIFAWAPNYAWSLEYLESNNAAFCVSDKNIEKGIYDYLKEIETNKVKSYIDNGKLLFDSKHEFYNNANRFSFEIDKAIKTFQNMRESNKQ